MCVLKKASRQGLFRFSVFVLVGGGGGCLAPLGLHTEVTLRERGELRTEWHNPRRWSTTVCDTDGQSLIVCNVHTLCKYTEVVKLTVMYFSLHVDRWIVFVSHISRWHEYYNVNIQGILKRWIIVVLPKTVCVFVHLCSFICLLTKYLFNQRVDFNHIFWK